MHLHKPMDIDKKKADQAPHPTKKAGIGGASQQDSPSVEAAKNNSKPGEPNPVILMTAEPTVDWNAKLLNPNNDSAKLNKLKGQKGGTVSPVRSSKRTAATSDQDSVEKATKLKARHNLDALNLICSKIAEGLGDGGCDPKGLQTPLSSVKGSRKKNRKSQSRSQ